MIGAIQDGILQSSRQALVTLLLLLCPLASTVRAQSNPSGPTGPIEPQGAFPDASFFAAFRKYAPPENSFSPFYSWDAYLGLDVTAFRKGVHGVELATILQTVGTENLGERVSVGGTGYILGVGYTHAFRRFKGSIGIRHLSSHLTRDLTHKEEDVAAGGGVVPTVKDASEYNVVFLKTAFSPVPPAEVTVIVNPISFEFDGDWGSYVRPVHLDARWTLWKGRDTALAAETQFELGRNPFDTYSLSLDLFKRDAPRGRLQLMFSVSPGHELHLSPIVGAVLDGVSFGVRMNFRS